MYLSGIGSEDLQFRPVEIVLGQGANLLVELGAALVVKILRRQTFLRGGSAIGHVSREGGPVYRSTRVMKPKSVVGKGLGLHGYLSFTTISYQSLWENLKPGVIRAMLWFDDVASAFR